MNFPSTRIPRLLPGDRTAVAILLLGVALLSLAAGVVVRAMEPVTTEMVVSSAVDAP